MNQDTTAIATKKVVVVDVTVEADLDAMVSYTRYYSSRNDYLERRIKALEEAVQEFHDHVRDHRSLDGIRLHVNRVVEEQCSVCHKPWETEVTECGTPQCASCGTAVG